MHREFEGNERYKRTVARPSECFGIEHFAGFVDYSADKILEKNVDFVEFTLRQVMLKSPSAFMAELFASERDKPKSRAKSPTECFQKVAAKPLR